MMRQMKLDRNCDPMAELQDHVDYRSRVHYGEPLSMPLELPAGAYYLVDSNEAASNHLGYPLQPVEQRKLDAGDYSIELAGSHSLEKFVAVERKSFPNLLGECAGHNRKAMEEKLDRLAVVRFPLVVIETSWQKVVRGHYTHSGGQKKISLHPHAVIGSIISWSLRRRIPFWFAGSRAEGERLTKWWLVRAARDHIERK